ncbi:hypothetical protein B0H19DRAFT_1160526 [Mycena capillaripes]|nr:hypothetical protein B0H19DRAFT_1160526 [Mycena capillaripes]
MHPALDIPEIVALLCESSRSKACIAALAQTRNFFLEPALEVLWREMHSLVPLLKCFPADLWEVSTLDGEPFSFNFIGVIRPEHWTRVRLHAFLIKEITFGQEDLYLGRNVADTVYSALCGRHLLPQLQKMTWRLGEFPYRHFLTFLGPVATKISLTIDSTTAYLSNLQNLALRSPPLTEVSVFGWVGSRFDSDENFESLVVRRLHQLRLIDIPVFEARTVHHIAALRDLRSLSLALRTISPEIAPPTLTATFPSLRTLALQAYTTAWPTYIMNMLQECPLTQLSLQFSSLHFTWLPEFNEPEPPAAYAELNHAINTHCAAAALTSFRAAYCNDEASALLFIIISADTLRPLYGFSNLRSVVIRVARVDLTDEELGELAAAWPRLECLSLGSDWAISSAERPYSSRPSFPPRLTLGSFAQVAEHCAVLVHLGLEFDARVVPDPPTNQAPHLRLKKLNVHTSMLDSPAEVVVYITRIFPAIQAIEVVSSVPEGQPQERLSWEERRSRKQKWMETLEFIRQAPTSGKAEE